MHKLKRRNRCMAINQDKIDQAWKKAKKYKSLDPNQYRKCPISGHKIRKTSYGKKSPYGWEIDHIHRKAKGGSDAPFNLRAVHWKANRERG